MIATPKPKGRYRRRPAKAPKKGTELALRYLESYLSDKPNRKVATAALLGCSLRTAASISNRTRPYQGAFKMSWVYRLCAAVGRPVERILGVDQKTFGEALVGWIGAKTSAQAIQDAMDIGHAIISRAHLAFDLSGSMMMQHEGGDPLRVDVELSAAPHMVPQGGYYGAHHIVVFADHQAKMMRLRYMHPDDGLVHDKKLTSTSLEKLLAHVHSLTKNVRAEIIRESASRAKDAQR